jgi:hypothetical protein
MLMYKANKPSNHRVSAHISYEIRAYGRGTSVHYQTQLSCHAILKENMDVQVGKNFKNSSRELPLRLLQMMTIRLVILISDCNHQRLFKNAQPRISFILILDCKR